MSLKELLKSKGLTQSTIINLLKEKFGCYKLQQQISEWCVGKRLPDIETTYYLSKILNVSCDELISILLGGTS